MHNRLKALTHDGANNSYIELDQCCLQRSHYLYDCPHGIGRGGSKREREGYVPPKPQVIFYKHNTTSSCTILQVTDITVMFLSRDSLY